MGWRVSGRTKQTIICIHAIEGHYQYHECFTNRGLDISPLYQLWQLLAGALFGGRTAGARTPCYSSRSRVTEDQHRRMEMRLPTDAAHRGAESGLSAVSRENAPILSRFRFATA